MQMDLIEDEKVLFRTTADDLFVTTHRVRDGSESKFTSIMLEEVCSVCVGRTAYRWRLVLAVMCDALAAYFAFIVQDGQGSALSLSLALLGALSLVAYYVTRSSLVEIASQGARIQFEMSSVSEVAEFVGTLESAKNERYLLMARAGKGVAAACSPLSEPFFAGIKLSTGGRPRDGCGRPLGRGSPITMRTPMQRHSDSTSKKKPNRLRREYWANRAEPEGGWFNASSIPSLLP